MKSDFKNIFIDNEWVSPASTLEVKSPYDGKVVGVVGVGDIRHMKKAIDSAAKAFEEMKHLPVWKIAEGLTNMKQYIENNFEEIAKDLSDEAGKPLTIARTEVSRALHTFEDGIEESKRLYGETIPLDRRPWGENREAKVERFPIGVIAAITPFNFPLNLVAHKVVPAIASKNTVIVRPASQTPLCSYHLAKAYEASGLPKGGLNVLAATYSASDALVDDDRVKMISFTGSVKVGWELKKRAFRKKVVLELGGNAAVVVNDVTDIEKATASIVSAGFSNAGQSCISVQRVFVKDTLYESFLTVLTQKAEKLVVGDPRHEETQIASIISEKEADRVMEWIDEAVNSGASVLTGGKRKGNVIYPTILIDTKEDMKVNCMEVFGPIITVTPYTDLEKVFETINNSLYGLQAGIFTQNVTLIHNAYTSLQVGGVIVNDVPTWRIDHMPYGGIKESGVGREGVRYAMEEMTEPKLLVISY